MIRSAPGTELCQALHHHVTLTQIMLSKPALRQAQLYQICQTSSIAEDASGTIPWSLSVVVQNKAKKVPGCYVTVSE